MKWWKNILTKNFWWLKKNSKNSTKSCICDNDYIDTNVKVRDHCHINGNYRGPAHKDCNINHKLNHKIPIVFHNPKSYDSYLIMQQLGKFNLKISVIPSVWTWKICELYYQE